MAEATDSPSSNRSRRATTSPPDNDAVRRRQILSGDSQIAVPTLAAWPDSRRAPPLPHPPADRASPCSVASPISPHKPREHMSSCCSRRPREILPIASDSRPCTGRRGRPRTTTACQFRFGQDRQVCGNRPRRLKTLGSPQRSVVMSSTERIAASERLRARRRLRDAGSSETSGSRPTR